MPKTTAPYSVRRATVTTSYPAHKKEKEEYVRQEVEDEIVKLEEDMAEAIVVLTLVASD